MTSLLTKIVAGDIYRKTRFHDEKGNFMPLNQLCYVPLSILFFVSAKLFNKCPEMPWFTFNIVNYLKRIIANDWLTLEFGSGMSTIWLAKRVKYLYTIEHDISWYYIISKIIKKYDISNINYELRSLEDYSNLDKIPDQSVDFVVIDGCDRSKCLLASLNKLRPGGYIYLDNSDKDMTDENGDMRICEKILRENVKAKSGKLWEFTGLTVGMINCHQGMLVQL
jgi:hypothetical protein